MTTLRTARDLGAVLRDHRRRLELSQAELARRIGMNRRWVLEVEAGKPGAAVGRVLDALAAVGVQLSLAATATSERASVAGLPGPDLDIDSVVDGARSR